MWNFASKFLAIKTYRFAYFYFLICLINLVILGSRIINIDVELKQKVEKVWLSEAPRLKAY